MIRILSSVLENTNTDYKTIDIFFNFKVTDVYSAKNTRHWMVK